jgi:hypothetical protein
MLQSIKNWAKNLEKSFSKPQTYGSALEYYIVSNRPQNAGDVDRLTREFEGNRSEGHYWLRGL